MPAIPVKMVVHVHQSFSKTGKMCLNVAVFPGTLGRTVKVSNFYMMPD